MPDSIPALRSQRDAVLERMKQIDHLRRGSLSRQFFKTRRGGKPVQSGPYFVLQCFFKGHKCSQRIPASQAQEVKKQVENFRFFNGLAEGKSYERPVRFTRQETIREKLTPRAD